MTLGTKLFSVYTYNFTESQFVDELNEKMIVQN